jgi:Tol biopolymer transport system component
MNDEKKGEKEMKKKSKKKAALLKVIRFCPTSSSIQFCIDKNGKTDVFLIDFE